MMSTIPVTAKLHYGARRQAGVSRIIVMMMLVIIGITSAATIRNATSSEKLTNNIRVQYLAQQYAQAALRYCDRTLRVEKTELREGVWISIDGSTGAVFRGEIQTLPSEILQVLLNRSLDARQSNIYQYFSKFMKWADQTRKLGVRTNADQPDQAAIARAFGSEGIGLCRTEHMFFQGDRIQAVREMILGRR